MFEQILNSNFEAAKRGRVHSIEIHGQCSANFFGPSDLDLKMIPKRYNRGSGRFVSTNYNLTLSGYKIWRHKDCFVDLIGPEFIKGGFFIKTDRVIIGLSKELECGSVYVLCFDYFRVYVDKIQRFSEENICFGRNKYCPSPQYHHLTIDLNNKTINAVPFNCQN